MPQALKDHDFQLDALASGAGGTSAPRAPVTTDDERPLRDELRRQIARLERRLGELWMTAFPRQGMDWSVGAVGGPRVLGAAELERIRDALVVRIREAQTELGRRAEIEESNRNLLETMIADPDRYRWVRVSNEDLGERECKHWHSRPRWGILGMLLGWWRVKVSSGCPLARGGGPCDEQKTQEAPAEAAARDGAATGRREAGARPRRAAPASG